MIARDELGATPEERRVRAAVSGLRRAPADPAFRERLRREFVEGSIAPRLRVLPPAWRGPALAWGAVAAAAALVAVGFMLVRAPDYRVVGTEGAGVVAVEDKAIPITHARELSRALRRGGHVRVPEGSTLDLVAPGVLAVTLSGGSDAVLPPAPGRFGSRHVVGRVTAGDLFFSTGRLFRGATLDVETPEARAHVTGTMLAVLRDAEVGTCVCVMEGHVEVTPKGEEPIDVPAGARLISMVDGGTEMGRILHHSEHALHRLQDKSAKLLGR